MPVLSAENKFKQGLAAFVDGDLVMAAQYFRQAMAEERQRQVARPEMRYLSYYGLTLALCHRSFSQAIEACETASSRNPLNPVLSFNLGKAYLLAGLPKPALQAFRRALELSPGSRVFQREVARLDGAPLRPAEP